MADNNKITGPGIIDGTADPLKATTHSKLNGLYYYYLEQSLYSYNGSDNTGILGTTSAIANVAYVPFLNLKPSNIASVDFDVNRYGATGKFSRTPKVFRIQQSETPQPMVLAERYLYPRGQSLPAIHKRRHWSNESRLLDYPYRSIMFASNVFEPYQIIPHLMSTDLLENGQLKLECVQSLNPGGNFYVQVKGYKDDFFGIMERQYSTASVDIPNTSSAYSNYMSTQKAQAQAAVSNSMLQANVQHAGQTIMGAVGGGITGAISGMALGPAGIIGGAVSGMAIGGGKSALSGSLTKNLSTQMLQNQQLAYQQDLTTTPKSLVSRGGDIYSRIGDESGAFVMAADLQITDEYKQMLGDYFAMYGYKQNKVMFLHNHLRTRHYYNYIKTAGCNVKGTGVPKAHLEAIKSIFDQGVTLWHVARNGDKFLDYGMDNTEVANI